MGSGREPHPDLAAPLGRSLALEGVHLLTGGGRGVMAEVARAFVTTAPRSGLSLGVLPGVDSPPGYPNEWIEIPIRTHLPLSGEQGEDARSRNHVNVLTADVVVALPGGAGTSSEVRLALSYRRPIVALVPDRDRIPRLPEVVPAVADPAGALAFVRLHLGRGGD